ncbi:MAG: hypothetical protein CGEMS_1506 [Candidatus Campylobacter infans]|nr:MAG: hypothetical protein CGEMS_1506 [Candidatus Campylobacter infans]
MAGAGLGICGRKAIKGGGGLASCVRARRFYKGLVNFDFLVCGLKINFKILAFWRIKICGARV